MKKYFACLYALLFLFTACNIPKPNELSYKSEPVNTGKPCDDPAIPITVFSCSISASNYKGNEFPACFESAFSDSTFFTRQTECDSLTLPFKPVLLGKIKISSSKLIACDPVAIKDAKPFAAKFPKGAFDVQLAILKIPGNERVAFSRIVFSNVPVHRWVCATDKEQLPAKDYVCDCYGVDAGVGMFVDEEACRQFNLKGEQEWKKVFLNNTWNKHDFYGIIYSFDNYSFASFRTGYGDGCYSTYIGYDSSGRICRLLTDFRLLTW